MIERVQAKLREQNQLLQRELFEKTLHNQIIKQYLEINKTIHLLPSQTLLQNVITIIGNLYAELQNAVRKSEFDISIIIGETFWQDTYYMSKGQFENIKTELAVIPISQLINPSDIVLISDCTQLIEIDVKKVLTTVNIVETLLYKYEIVSLTNGGEYDNNSIVRTVAISNNDGIIRASSTEPCFLIISYNVAPAIDLFTTAFQNVNILLHKNTSIPISSLPASSPSLAFDELVVFVYICKALVSCTRGGTFEIKEATGEIEIRFGCELKEGTVLLPFLKNPNRPSSVASTNSGGNMNNTSNANVGMLNTIQVQQQHSLHRVYGRRIHILFVEDNPIIHMIVKKIHVDHDLDIATNGDDAFRLFQQGIQQHRPFDLIYMDVMIPYFDGIETTIKIRNHEKKHGLAPVPIIGLSGYEMYATRAIEAGMNEFRLKQASNLNVRFFQDIYNKYVTLPSAASH